MMYLQACISQLATKKEEALPPFTSTMDYIAGGSFYPDSINSFQQLRQILSALGGGKGNMD